MHTLPPALPSPAAQERRGHEQLSSFDDDSAQHSSDGSPLASGKRLSPFQIDARHRV